MSFLSNLIMVSKFLKGFTSKIATTLNTARREAFNKYLLFTNTWTSCILMFVGDLAQQEIEYQRFMLPSRYDWHRSFRMTVVGFGYGPLHHYFYHGIQRLWPVVTLSAVGKKIMADQFFMSPLCISYIFYTAGLLEGKTLSECTEELLSKCVHVYTVDWTVWPPTQFINFYFVPIKYQVLYINSMTTFYNVFLSYMKHREIAQENLKLYKQQKVSK